MLAEKKFKKKYSSVNAQNKNWYKSPDHFGAKMLSKMGWSEGKGLGANEQGMSEYIRVKERSDQYAGMGFDLASLNKVSSHMDNFNSILSSLQVVKSGDSNTTKVSKTPENMTEHCEEKQNKSISSSSSSSKLQNFDQVRRTKICKRRMQNKILSNKKQKDLDVILGRANEVMDLVRQSGSTKSSKISEKSSKSADCSVENSDEETNFRPSFNQLPVSNTKSESIDAESSDNEEQASSLTSFKSSEEKSAYLPKDKQETKIGQEYIHKEESVTDYFKKKMQARKLKMEQKNKQSTEGMTTED